MVSDDDVDRAFREWESRSQARVDGDHGPDCLLFDDRCCAQQWAAFRSRNERAAERVEALYGKDWWRSVPHLKRKLFCLLAILSPYRSDVESRGDSIESELVDDIDRAMLERVRRDGQAP